MSKQLSLFSFAKKYQHRDQEPSVAASSSSTVPPSIPTQLPNPTPPVCIPSSPTHHVAPTATACSVISRPKLVSYPKNKDNRSFNHDWYIITEGSGSSTLRKRTSACASHARCSIVQRVHHSPKPATEIGKWPFPRNRDS